MFENKYIKKLKPYSLVSQEVFNLKNKNLTLKLDWNEATIDPSPKVYVKLRQTLKKGKLQWYPPLKNKKLLSLLSKYSKLEEKYIQYYPSSDSIHEYIARAFVCPRDKIVIISPTYDNFRVTIESFGGDIIYYNLNKKFEFNYNDFIRFLKKKNPKMVYICNPNNPTGTIYSKETIEKLISKFNKTLFIVDEAYYEFGGVSSKDLVKKYKNIIITRTFSKAFALAAFRIGYLLSCEDNIKILDKIRNPKNVTALTQEAAIAALEDKEYMLKYVTEVKLAKQYFCNELKKLELSYISGGGNFILINFKKHKNRIMNLNKQQLFVREYKNNILDGWIRITIGTREDMKRVISILKGCKNE